MSETEVFADLDVAQDLSKRVQENDSQEDTMNLTTNVDYKPSTSELNVSYGEEAPTPTDSIQGQQFFILLITVKMLHFYLTYNKLSSHLNFIYFYCFYNIQTFLVYKLKWVEC